MVTKLHIETLSIEHKSGETFNPGDFCKEDCIEVFSAGIKDGDANEADVPNEVIAALTGKYCYDEEDGGGGIGGAIAAALVEQVVGSLADRTPELSRRASTTSIRNTNQGLLPGPYRKEKATTSQ